MMCNTYLFQNQDLQNRHILEVSFHFDKGARKMNHEDGCNEGRQGELQLLHLLTLSQVLSLKQQYQNLMAVTQKKTKNGRNHTENIHMRSDQPAYE